MKVEVVTMTREELREFAEYVARTAVAEVLKERGMGADTPEPIAHGTDDNVVKVSGMVKGLSGISSLFGVSRVTASLWANSWLAPAVTRVGRTLWVDKDKALKLHMQQDAPRGRSLDCLNTSYS